MMDDGDSDDLEQAFFLTEEVSDLRIHKKDAKSRSLPYPSLNPSVSNFESTDDDTLDDRAKTAKKKNKLFRNFSKHGGKEKKVKGFRKKSKTSSEEFSSIIGCPLYIAADRTSLNDGVLLPQLVRDCIDAIERKGLHVPGLYQVEVNRNSVDDLKERYDQHRVKAASLLSYDTHVVAALLKCFLKELPGSIFATMQVQFEEAANDENNFINAAVRMLPQLPSENLTLVQWLFTHFRHVVEQGTSNGMAFPTMVQFLSNLLSLKPHLVVHCLRHPTFLATTNIVYHTGILQTQSANSYSVSSVFQPDASSQQQVNAAMSPPDSPDSLRKNLQYYEDSLASLHNQCKEPLSNKSEVEEKLWEVQRIVTSYKRKLRQLKANEATKPNATNGASDNLSSNEPSSVSTSQISQSNSRSEDIADSAQRADPLFDDVTVWCKFHQTAAAEMSAYLRAKVTQMKETVELLEKTRDEISTEYGLPVSHIKKASTESLPDSDNPIAQKPHAETQALLQRIVEEVNLISRSKADLLYYNWKLQQPQQNNSTLPHSQGSIPEDHGDSKTVSTKM